MHVWFTYVSGASARRFTVSRSSSAAAGEDVLLSEARIVSESEESWQPSARPFPAGNFDPRTALFKAREAYREKIRANAMASRQSAIEGTAGAFDRAERGPSELATTAPETEQRAAAWDDDPQHEREPASAAAALLAAVLGSARLLVGSRSAALDGATEARRLAVLSEQTLGRGERPTGAQLLVALRSRSAP